MPLLAMLCHREGRGTDITRMPYSWRQCVTVFTEELPWLKGRDLELVIGKALCNWVGWRLPGSGQGSCVYGKALRLPDTAGCRHFGYTAAG
jgi:hypothetical protein